MQTASGAPLANQEVALLLGDKTYHTLTNRLGEFKFLTAAVFPEHVPASVLLNKTIKKVSIGSTTKIVVPTKDIPRSNKE